jgi:hypothetical protein
MEIRFSWKLILVLNTVGIALAAAGAVTMMQVDVIVHNTLYNYGLQFDYEWAIPYWTYERLSLAVLGCAGALNAFSLFYVLLSRRISRGELKPDSPAQEAAAAGEERSLKEKPTELKDDGVEIVAIPMVCNKCGKVFSQPLCMFDFKSGKPRLVNVCPYCNAVLAVTGNSKYVEK